MTSFREATDVVLRHLKADPAFYDVLLNKLDRDRLRAFVAPTIHYPIALPMTANRVEIAIFDNGGSKAKRPRKDQTPCRFNAKFQFYKNGDSFASPSWVGEARLRAPDLAENEMLRLSKPTHCKTPFSSDYRAFIGRVCDTAREQDCLVGFLCHKVAEGLDKGTYYLDQHVLLVPNKLEEQECASAMLITGEYANVERVFTFPAFDTKDANGNPFSRKVILQSRGTRLTKKYSDWRTGAFTID